MIWANGLFGQRVDDVTGVGRQTSLSRRLWAAPALLCAALALSACGDASRFEAASSVKPTVPAKPPKPAVVQTPAAEKEHERILASYGGAYDDPRLESLITKTVDRLVAASERPDLAGSQLSGVPGREGTLLESVEGGGSQSRHSGRRSRLLRG